jgi:2-methylisocitrate lyase-like PEP mutase family enzyme
VNWALGYRDGEAAPFEEAVAAVGRIARAVEVPVSADFEGGFVSQSGGIDRTIEALVEAGAAGVNLEDGVFGGDPAAIVPAEEHADLIAGARAAAERLGVPLFVNGRTDVFWRKVGEDGERSAEAVRRLVAYREAGSDCGFAPGIMDPDDIAEVVQGIGMPFNVMHTRGLPGLGELADLGVGRISFGADFYLGALAVVERGAEGLRQGDLEPLEGLGMPSMETLKPVAGM